MSSSNQTWTVQLTAEEFFAIVRQINHDIRRVFFAKLWLQVAGAVLVAVLFLAQSHTVTPPNLGGTSAGVARLHGTPDSIIGK